MQVLLGSDKSGFPLKEAIKQFLSDKGYTVEDCGTTSIENGIPYFEVAQTAAEKVQSGQYARAILICGTGAGMAVVANKFKGVYAVASESLYSAEKARAINNANILTMGGWIIGEQMGCDMAERFLTTEFTENLEAWRKDFLKNADSKVHEFENRQFPKDK